MTRRIVPLLPVLALLAACGTEPTAEEEGGKAAGEVLGGTISDEMIAFDQLTSQSPPERSTGDSSAGVEQGSAEDENEPASAPEPETEAAPAGEPAEE